MNRKLRMNQESLDQTQRYYLRINLYQRLLHGMLMLSFLGLAASGMPLRFNHSGWASELANAMGGFGAILFFHKTFAFLMTLCFLLHLAATFRNAFIKGEIGVFWGPDSMVPQPRDLI